MHIEEIEYTDYNGEQHKEKFYFNLNQTELIELNFSKKGGYESWLRRIIAEHDNTKIVPLVRQIILTAYGEKSDDGIHFNKSSQISDAFYHSDAYNKLFVKLFTNTGALVQFCNDIIPKDLRDEVKDAVASGKLKEDPFALDSDGNPAVLSDKTE